MDDACPHCSAGPGLIAREAAWNKTHQPRRVGGDPQMPDSMEAPDDPAAITQPGVVVGPQPAMHVALGADSLRLSFDQPAQYVEINQQAAMGLAMRILDHFRPRIVPPS